MKRLYQWFRKRASFFRSGTPGQGTMRTVRTEVTVKQEGMTLLVGGVAASFDVCPLCGQKLPPAQMEHAHRPLLEGSISPEPASLDRPPPRSAGGSTK